MVIGGKPVNARSAMIANRVDEGPAAKEQKNEVQSLSRLSLRDLSDFVPKGLKDSARGFNPWKHVHPETRPEGAEDIRDLYFVWSTSAHPEHRFYRPLRGGPFFNRYLGLKPQAESFSPFGTQNLRELQFTPELLHSTRRLREPPVRRSPCSMVPTAQIGFASEARSTTRTLAKSEGRQRGRVRNGR